LPGAVLVVDNYDSFTYNLVQYLRELGADVVVHRNDAVGLEGLSRIRLHAIVLSPGPGRPENAGITEDVVRALGGKVPMLGVCLGHQAIARVHGARIGAAPALMHGKTSEIHPDGRGVFSGLPSPFPATRYHSLIVDPSSVPRELELSAWTEDGSVMGLRRRPEKGAAPLEGVQFHPESILTAEGKRLMANFLAMAGRREPPAGD